MYIYTIWLENDEKHNIKAGQSRICRVPRRFEHSVRKYGQHILGNVDLAGTVICAFGEGQTIEKAKENAIKIIKEKWQEIKEINNVLGRNDFKRKKILISDLKKIIELVNKTSKEIEILCVLEFAKNDASSHFFIWKHFKNTISII